MYRKVCSFFLVLLLSVTTAGATVIDYNAPYFGDYLFVYNPTTSNVSLSAATTSVQQFSLQGEEVQEEPQRVHWSPALDDLSLRQDCIVTEQPNVLDAPILYAASPQLGDTLTYLVSNLLTGNRYSKEFIYLASGQYCNVLVEPNSDGTPKLTSLDVEKIITEFDHHIQPFMVENFGNYYTYLGIDPNRYLQYSKNTKMDILLYDIQDGFNNTTVRSYVGGYTDITDFISTERGGNGNERGILHIDIYPLMGIGSTPLVEQAYSTIVHEFQHQISYSDSLFDYFTGKTDYYINETWWNEAFSMAAEHLYSGDALTYRIDSYNQCNNSSPARNGLILDYDDYSENNNHIASNYGISYLFGQYLRCQTKDLDGGGNRIYRTILEETGTDYTAILAGLSRIGYAHTPKTYEELYRNFRMATILKNPDGPYGFMGEETFSKLSNNTYSGTSSITLKPGAAVVLSMPKNYTPSANSQLTYTAFSQRGAFTYALNTVDEDTLNITHGTLPQNGVALWAAGYTREGKLLGTDCVTVTNSQENYDYNLPKDSVLKKFFLLSADGSLKPFAYAESE